MYKAKLNAKNFIVEATDSGLTINDQPFHWDLINVSDGYFHILHQYKSYRAEVVRIDAETRTVVLKINGHTHTVDVQDKLDLLLEKMGMASGGLQKINNIKAPMPGLIIDLKIKPGDSVKPGDQLLILEAMKMENILKSSGDGIVKEVKVKKGDSVEKGQVLIVFD
jgi:biotin carboxyl carrier protein